MADAPGLPEEPRGPEELVDLGARQAPGRGRIRAKFTCDPGHEEECYCVRFSPDGQLLAASFAGGAIHVFDTATGRQEIVLNGSPTGSAGAQLNAPALRQPTTRLRWKPTGEGVLTSVSAEFREQVRHWNVQSGACLGSITEPDNNLFCLDYSGDGACFATAGHDRTVRLYDGATQALTRELGADDLKEAAGHSNRIFSLKFHPAEPSIILSGGWDRTVRVWDSRSGRSEKTLWDCYICGDAVDVSSDGSRVLTGSKQVSNALQIWDFGTGRVAHTVEWASADSPSTSLLLAAQFSKDLDSGMILAGGSQEHEARFYDCPEGRSAVAFAALVGVPKPVFSVDFSPTGRAAAVGGADGLVRVLELL